MQAVDYKKISEQNRRGRNLADFMEEANRIKAERSSMGDLLSDEITKEIQENNAELIADIIKGKKDRQVLENIVKDIIEKSENFKGYAKKELIKEHIDQILGWGKLQPLIDEGNITNIFTNMRLEVVKRVGGKDIPTNIRFETDEELEQFIKNIMIRTGEKINRDKCIADTYDPLYNVRINAGIYGSPTRKEVVGRPYLALRLYPAREFLRQDFINNETMNDEIADFFEEYGKDAVMAIVGEPDAGKSTVLDYIISLNDPMKRTIILQEEEELKFMNDNCLFLTERRAGKEDKRHRYDLAEFTKVATRLAGKEVIISELRGNEAWFIKRLIDMGYIAKYTVHGSSCLSGIKQTAWLMSLYNPQMSILQMEKELCKTLQFLVFVHQRKVVDVAEVIGFDDAKQEPILNFIFQLEVDENDNFVWRKGNLSPDYIKKKRLMQKLKEREV